MEPRRHSADSLPPGSLAIRLRFPDRTQCGNPENRARKNAAPLKGRSRQTNPWPRRSSPGPDVLPREAEVASIVARPERSELPFRAASRSLVHSTRLLLRFDWPIPRTKRTPRLNAHLRKSNPAPLKGRSRQTNPWPRRRPRPCRSEIFPWSSAIHAPRYTRCESSTVIFGSVSPIFRTLVRSSRTPSPREERGLDDGLPRFAR